MIHDHPGGEVTPIVRRCGACRRPAAEHHGGPPRGCPGWDAEGAFDGPWGWREREGLARAERYRDIMTAPIELSDDDEQAIAALLGRA